MERNKTNENREQVLIVTAVEAERDAVTRGLGGDARFRVIAAGVGPAAAAAGTAVALLRGEGSFRLVISAGIAGGFVGRVEVGSLAVASELVAADLGVRTAEGFRSVEELGFGTVKLPSEPVLAARLAVLLRESAARPVALGPVLTVSTVTGTAEAAAEHASRVPGAVAEAMEGFGVAVAARELGVPVLELRAISNAVGPRDRAAWRIAEAMQALEAAGPALIRLLEEGENER